MNLRAMTGCGLVTDFFLSRAAFVPILLRRLALPPRKKKILAGGIFSVLAKLTVTLLSISTLPESVGDYTTWKTVTGLLPYA